MKNKISKVIALFCAIVMILTALPISAEAIRIGSASSMIFDIYYGNVTIDGDGARGPTSTGGWHLSNYSKDHTYIIEGASFENNALKHGYHLDIDGAAYYKAFGKSPTVILKNEDGKPLYIYTGDGGEKETVSNAPPIYIHGGYVKLIVQCDTFLYGAANEGGYLYGWSGIQVDDTAYLDLVLEDNLTVVGGRGAAGIGASATKSGGAVEISAVVDKQTVELRATGGKAADEDFFGSAGIGTGTNTTMDEIYIRNPDYSYNAERNGYAFNVIAEGTGHGAGIGSGSSFGELYTASVNFIKIAYNPNEYNLLSVRATGGKGGAGIGCGQGSYKSVIEINNGFVWATGRGGAAGIGAGQNAKKNPLHMLAYYAKSRTTPPSIRNEYYTGFTGDGLNSIMQQEAEIEIHGGEIEAYNEGYGTVGIGGGQNEEVSESLNGNILNTNFADAFQPTPISGGLVIIKDPNKKEIKNYEFDIPYQTSIVIDSVPSEPAYYGSNASRTARPLTKVYAYSGLGGGNKGTAYVKINGGSVVVGDEPIGGGIDVPTNSGSYIYLQSGFLLGGARTYTGDKKYTKLVVDGGSMSLRSYLGTEAPPVFNSKDERLYCAIMPSVQASDGSLTGYDRAGVGFEGSYLTFENDAYSYTLESTPAYEGNSAYLYYLWLPKGKYEASCAGLDGYVFSSDVKEYASVQKDPSDVIIRDTLLPNYMGIKTEPLTIRDEEKDLYKVSGGAYEVIYGTGTENQSFPLISLIEDGAVSLIKDRLQKYKIKVADETILTVENGKIVPKAIGSTTVTISDASLPGFPYSKYSFYNARELTLQVNVVKPHLGGWVTVKNDTTNNIITADLSQVTHKGADTVDLEVKWYNSQGQLVYTGNECSTTLLGEARKCYLSVRDTLGKAEGVVTAETLTHMAELSFRTYYTKVNDGDINVTISGTVAIGSELSIKLVGSGAHEESKEENNNLNLSIVYRVEVQDEKDPTKWTIFNTLSNPDQPRDMRNKTSYTIPDELLGKKLRISLEYWCQHKIMDGATAHHFLVYTCNEHFELGTVGKKAYSGDIAAPTLKSRTEDSITLEHKEGYEYSTDLSTWSVEDTIGGLNEATAYMIYYRIAETDKVLASSAGSVLISTEPVQKKAMPTADLRLESKVINGLSDSMAVSFDRGEHWLESSGYSMGLVRTFQVGDEIWIKDTGNDGQSYDDSDVQVIVISAMEKPVVQTIEYPSQNETEGLVRGVSGSLEYREKGASDWTPYTGGSLRLPVGTWELRYAALGEKLAGEATEIVMERASADTTLKSLSVNAGGTVRSLSPAEIVEATAENGLELTISGKAYDTGDITVAAEASDEKATVGEAKVFEEEGAYSTAFEVMAEDNKTFSTYFIKLHFYSVDEDEPAPILKYYTITASAGAGGSISPSGGISVREGGDQAFTVTPQTGYVISDVVVDGMSVMSRMAGNTYTLENVRAGHTINATFKAESGEKPDPDKWDDPFTDVLTADWFYGDVRYVVLKGLMVGVSNTEFGPLTLGDRAMITTIIWRLEGAPVVDYAMTFPDVSADDYYFEAVRWAASEGVIKGYANGNLGTFDPITREQLATLLYRYALKTGMDGSTNTAAGILPFSDASEVSDWALDAMNWAVGEGLIQGEGDNLLDPQGGATRAEFAAVLHRYVGK